MNENADSFMSLSSFEIISLFSYLIGKYDSRPYFDMSGLSSYVLREKLPAGIGG